MCSLPRGREFGREDNLGTIATRCHPLADDSL